MAIPTLKYTWFMIHAEHEQTEHLWSVLSNSLSSEVINILSLSYGHLYGRRVKIIAIKRCDRVRLSHATHV